MAKFINLTNHPSTKWGQEQLDAARQFADEIIDVSFPNVPPAADEAEVHDIGERVLEHLNSLGSIRAVLVQGEFTLTHFLVTELHKRGTATCVAATTDRKVVGETIAPDGTAKKDVVFTFKRFRKYI